MLKSLLTATCAFLICTCVSLAAADGPLTAWSFDDPADLGAATGSVPIAGVPGAGATADPAGKIGGALSLDGSSGALIDLGDPDELQLTTYSISGWFKTSDMSDYRVITSRNVNWTNRTWWVTIWKQGGGQGHTDGALVWRTSSSGAEVDLASQGSVADGQWHHFAVVLDGNTKAELWLDGVLQDSLANPGTPHLPAITALIGAERPGKRHFNGQIDELQIHARPLAKSEIEVAAENVLYREVFTMDGEDDLGNPVTFRRPIESFGWLGIQKYHFDYAAPAEHGERASFSGLAAVNSAPYAGADAVDGGMYTSNPEFPVLLLTQEYRGIDISQVHEIRFAQQSGINSKMFVAIQVGEEWYVSATPYVCPVDGLLDTKTFTTASFVLAEHRWDLLEVDGTFGEDGGLLKRNDIAHNILLPKTGTVNGFGVFTERNGVSNKWAIDDYTIIGTNDPVVPPTAVFAVDVPASSKVSPVCIEGVKTDNETVVATVNGIAHNVVALGDYVFYADVELSKDAVTAVQLTNATETIENAIAWEPTPCDGGQVSIRVNDRLLIQGVSGGSIDLGVGSGVGSETIDVGTDPLVPITFTKPGYFTLISLDAEGAQVGTLDVTVVQVDFPQSLAVHVTNPRLLPVRIYPAGSREECEMSSNDPYSMDLYDVVNSTTDDNVLRMHVRPLGRGRHYAIARLASGVIIGAGEVEEYQIETKAIEQIIVNGTEQFGSAQVLIRPFVSDLDLRLVMFAHTATFSGGDTEIMLNTSTDFSIETDANTGEQIGIAVVDIEFPPGETQYCFNIYASQDIMYPTPPAIGDGVISITAEGDVHVAQRDAAGSPAVMDHALFANDPNTDDDGLWGEPDNAEDENGPVAVGVMGNINGNNIIVVIDQILIPVGGGGTLIVNSMGDDDAHGEYSAIILGTENKRPLFVSTNTNVSGDDEKLVYDKTGSKVETYYFEAPVSVEGVDDVAPYHFDVQMDETAFTDRIIVVDLQKRDMTAYRWEHASKTNPPKIGPDTEVDGSVTDYQQSAEHEGARLLLRVVGPDVEYEVTPEFRWGRPVGDDVDTLEAKNGVLLALSDEARAAARAIDLAVINDVLPDGRKVIADQEYQPPPEFDISDPDRTDLMRSFDVRAREVNHDECILDDSVVLTRPPVVCVHGINSNSSIWTEPVNANGTSWLVYFRTKGYVTEVLTHSPSTFGNDLITDAYVAIRDTIRGVAVPKIHAGLRHEDKRLAIHKVDVVAHSYGGLLARWYTEISPEYQTRKDFRKLVTLGTPHRGSPITNTMCEAYSNKIIYEAQLNAPIVPDSPLISLGEVLRLAETKVPIKWYKAGGTPISAPDQTFVMPSLKVISLTSSYLRTLNHEPFDDDIRYGSIIGNKSSMYFILNGLSALSPYQLDDGGANDAYFPWYHGLDGGENDSDAIVPVWSQRIPGSEKFFPCNHIEYYYNEPVRDQVAKWLNNKDLSSGKMLEPMFEQLRDPDMNSRDNMYVGHEQRDKSINAGYVPDAIIRTQFTALLGRATPGGQVPKNANLEAFLDINGGLIEVTCTGMVKDANRTLAAITDEATGDTTLTSGIAIPYAGSGELRTFSVTRYVGRTIEAHIAGDVARDTDWEDDYYIAYEVSGAHYDGFECQSPSTVVWTTGKTVPAPTGNQTAFHELDAYAEFDIKGGYPVSAVPQDTVRLFIYDNDGIGNINELLHTVTLTRDLPAQAFVGLLLPYKLDSTPVTFGLWLDQSDYIRGSQGSSEERGADIFVWFKDYQNVEHVSPELTLTVVEPPP